MTPTPASIETQIRGIEKAIRLLTGEQRGIASRLAGAVAMLKLERSRLLAAQKAMRAAQLVPGMHFPDVSGWQSSVDIAAVHATGAHLMVTKLTEGIDFTDPDGLARLGQMTAAGFARRGAYHYLHPSYSGIGQAEHFLAAGGHALGKDDIAICDLEVSDGMAASAIRNAAKSFSATLRQHIPAEQWLYIGGPFARQYGVPLDPFDHHWLPAYVVNPTPYMVYGRAAVAAWQYTDGHYGPTPHTCAGIGACDLSVVVTP